MSKKIIKHILVYVTVWVALYFVWTWLAWYPRREQLFLQIVWWGGFLFILMNNLTND